MSGQPYVDADTAALLARMAGDFAGAPADPTVEQRRQGLDIAGEIYGPQAAQVASVEDRTIAGPNGDIPVRIYRPREPAGDQPPLLVHIHGGGWVLGGPDGYTRVVTNYCDAGGCVVVDVNYRRAPENKHPAALLDCDAALAWAAANAQALGCDPDRIFVTGDSAGGHLTAAVCQITKVKLAGQILLYPVTSASRHADFASRKDLGDGRYFLREFDILRAETEYFNDDADREHGPASPVLADAATLAKTPPALVITAGLDPLRDEGEAYAKALAAAGVPTTYECVAGTIHAYVLFAGQIGLGRETIARIGRFVRGLG